MLRVAKPSSPMSVGTWILVAYGPGSGLAAAAELLPPPLRASRPGRLLIAVARPAGLSAAAFAPGVASYTAALLAQTAAPAWHDARRELPFVYTGSAAASGGAVGMLFAPVAGAGPARRFAAAGAAVELVASRLIVRRPGVVRQAWTTGARTACTRRLSCSPWAVRSPRSRWPGAAGSRPPAGVALLAGSALQRFGTFQAGIASTRDPKYVVVPQRERLNTRT